MQVDMAWIQGGFNSMANGGTFWDGAWRGGVTGLINAGFSFLNVPGMIPNGFLHAGTNILGNGISNTLFDKPFFDNWGYSAGTGFAGGAYSGYQLSKEGGLNYWWGTKSENWGYNRDQWSLACWDKPDRINFQDVQNRVAGEINCMAKSFQDMYGNTEQYWDTYTNSGDDLHTLDHIRADGGQAMKYPGDNAQVTFDEISKLNQDGGRGMITLDNYRNSGSGHAMALKKILYVPGKRFDALMFDPYNGGRYLIQNFNQGTTLGENLRFWFLRLHR